MSENGPDARLFLPSPPMASKYLFLPFHRRLMFCDGACGQINVEPRGDCGVITSDKAGRGINFSLENNGIKHTSNRADLHSVILGLGLREWSDEGFESIVVAMESAYVVLEITEGISRWI